MSHRGRKIVDDSKAGGKKNKGRVKESDRKEEITSTEFPEGGNTTSTKSLLASQRGRQVTK